MKYKGIDEKLRNRAEFIALLDILNSEKESMVEPILITFVNPYSYRVMSKRKELIKNFQYIFADGASLVFLHNLFRRKKIDRVSFDFSSIAVDVFGFIERNKLKVGLIGARESEIKLAKNNILTLYPSLDVAYSRNGYFTNTNDYNTCYEELKNREIDVLILGMGTPFQEEFAVRLKEQDIGASLIITCGGFLTQTSVRSDYYHPFIKLTGLRWLQRAFSDKHVRKRLLFDYPIFFFFYIFNSSRFQVISAIFKLRCK